MKRLGLLLISVIVASASLFAAAQPDPLTPEERRWLREHGPLRYAPDPYYPPFEWYDDSGTLRGLSVEVLRLVARRLDTSIEPVRYSTWEEVMRVIRRGEIDVVSSVVETRERMEFLEFSPPYLTASSVFFVQSASAYERVDDLRGKRVGVVSGYALEDQLKRRGWFKVVSFTSTQEGVAMLALGKIDALAENQRVGSYVITAQALAGIRVLPEEFMNDAVHFATPKVTPILASILAKGLAAVNGEEVDEILRKWTPVLREVKRTPRWVAPAVWAGSLILAVVGGWSIWLRLRLRQQTRRFRRERAATIELRRQVFENSPIPLAVLDGRSLRFVDGNAAALRAFGIESVAQLTNLSPAELVASTVRGEPESSRDILPWFRIAVEAGYANREWRFRRPGGLEWDADVTVQRFASDGRMLLQCTVQDITQRRKAEAELAATQANYQLLFDRGPIPMLIYHTETLAVLAVNDAFCQHYGYADHEAQRLSLPDLFSEEDRPQVAEIVASLKQQPYRNELNHFKRDGTQIRVVTNSHAIDFAGAPARLVAINDVTAQRRAEQERESLQSQLLQAQKMEAIGQLAGGIAHDFNNVLTVYTMHLALLGEARASNESVAASVAEMAEATERAVGLTRQLLLFSRRQVVQKRTIDLDSLIGVLMKMLRRLIGEHVSIEMRGWSEPTWVHADGGMLEQVVMNLVVNARDAMPKGGRITITTESARFSGGEGEKSAHPQSRPGRFVCMTVRDAGCGMTPEVMARIFDPFFTTKEAGKGTGLGLSTVFGIVQQHDGWVEVESTLNVGTCFRIYLPAVEAVVAEGPTARKPEPAEGGVEAILVAEDNREVRKLASSVLTGLGYRVVVAENGQEALNCWTKEQGQFDLLLTDMIMPEGLSGLELAHLIRQQKPDLKVIIMSGYSLELSTYHELSKDRIVYLAKPFDPQTLGKAVRKVLNGVADVAG